MGLGSEEEVATALVAAVQSYAAAGTGTRPLPQVIEDCLHTLLDERGSDGILELSVSQPRSTCITILGIVIWVTEQTLSPLEAEFQLDKAGGAVKSLTIRAGDGRISRRNAPEYPQSWRKLHRIIASRTTVDEDWAHVLHYEFA